jgi:hypothetical protein
MTHTKLERIVATCVSAIVYLVDVGFTAINVVWGICTICILYKGCYDHWYEWLAAIVYLAVLALIACIRIKERTDKFFKYEEEQERKRNGKPEWQKHCNVDECPLISGFNNKEQ